MQKGPMEQHDDHIWMVVNGEGWAIHKIVHHHDLTIFHFWRGYEPDIEYCSFSAQGNWQQDYCDMACWMMEDYFGEIGFAEV